jgi:hypothetical protein
MAQAGRLQPVAAGPQEADPFGDGPEQLDGVALGHARGAGGRAPRLADAGGAGGHPGLGRGQAAVGEQGEPVAVGGELDQGVEAGEQPAVVGAVWGRHGVPPGDGTQGGRSLPRHPAGQK